jgi:hypothetical protein
MNIGSTISTGGGRNVGKSCCERQKAHNDNDYAELNRFHKKRKHHYHAVVGIRLQKSKLL